MKINVIIDEKENTKKVCKITQRIFDYSRDVSVKYINTKTQKGNKIIPLILIRSKDEKPREIFKNYNYF